jgi:hypothetical protein
MTCTLGSVMNSNIALGFMIAVYLAITGFSLVAARTHGRVGDAVAALSLPR